LLIEKRDQLFSNLHSSEILTSNLTETNETMSYSTDQLLMQQDRALLGIVINISI
jgi:hypothetical protein